MVAWCQWVLTSPRQHPANGSLFLFFYSSCLGADFPLAQTGTKAWWCEILLVVFGTLTGGRSMNLPCSSRQTKLYFLYASTITELTESAGTEIATYSNQPTTPHKTGGKRRVNHVPVP